MDRLPYQATPPAAAYERIALPAAVLLDNVRSMYNVGAFFRTADAAAIEKLYLCGITSHPPKRQIAKTALGAEQTVAWEHSWDAPAVVRELRARGYEIAAVETSLGSVDLFDWTPPSRCACCSDTKWTGCGPSCSRSPTPACGFPCSAQSTRSTSRPRAVSWCTSCCVSTAE
jgi:hypothetical protein